MTQLELIANFKKNFEKVTSFHGLDSDETTYAFFLLQAARINVPHKEIYDWASKKMDALHEEALDMIEIFEK